MKAINVLDEGDVPKLVWREAPDVRHGKDEVLIRVGATAVNRADLAQASGNYPPPAGVTNILGLEMAGIIVDLGSRVRGWKKGDRVCALLAGGGYAEYVAVHHEMLLRLPADWSFQQGAAIPEVWLTAFVNLFAEGNLKKGETALIHAGGSGVGTAAVQLIAECGARAIVTAGTQEKLATCLDLGAEGAVNYKEQDFGEAVGRLTEHSGVDLILDPVGGSYLEKNISLLKPGGRLIQIGLLGSRKGSLDLGRVLGRSLRIIGSRLRPRSLEEKIQITSDFRDEHWRKFSDGRLKPIIDTVYPIESAQAAHQYVRANRNIGKVILKVE